MDYLNLKGLTNFASIEDINRPVTIYQNTNLDELLYNKADINFMLKCI